MAADRPIIAVTAGEPAGVGPEIVLQAALDTAVSARARIYAIGERSMLLAAAKVLGARFELELAADPSRAAYRPGTVTALDTAMLPGGLEWGAISAAGGAAAYRCVATAIELALAGTVAAMATAPIHKESLRAAAVPYIDHTGILTGLTGSADAMTMFATGKLRIFFLTRHLALRDVAAALTIDGVDRGIRSAVGHLRSIGFPRPRLAVAAFNPHGGEHGLFGDEEERVLRPAIARASRDDPEAEIAGPVPADAVFHQAAGGAYDAVLSLYHDQGHIAAKTLDFHGTVSFTLGLPFLRTSVDHGTAFDIAGTGRADPRGMKAAILAAAEFALPYRAWRAAR